LGTFEIFPESKDKFFLEDFEALINFVRNDMGRIKGKIVHRDQVDIEAKKVK